MSKMIDEVTNYAKETKLDEILAENYLLCRTCTRMGIVLSSLRSYKYIRKYLPAEYGMRYYVEPIPNIFKFLNFSSEIRSDYEESVVFDLFIAMDCGMRNVWGNPTLFSGNTPVLTTMCLHRGKL